jgi:fatty-acyl-CoA synthase
MRSTFERFKKLLNINQLMSTYGMTENTISTTFNRLDDPIERCCLNQAPILGPTEIILMDPTSGTVCAPNEIGEVWCRGETVMLGYYKNPQATQDTVSSDGWLKTGDLGCMDREGYLSITGRLTEMYKSGGTNVYPAEIEQHLVKHQAIKMVAVVSVPDERLSEVGFAFVECHEGHSVTLPEIRDFCQGALAAYKVPRYLKIVTAIPRTSTGKIQKAALSDLAKQDLNPT